MEKGFAEARKILDGMGVLQGKVASDIDDTYQKIQDGFSDLNKRFNPDAALVEGSARLRPTASALPLRQKPSIWK